MPRCKNCRQKFEPIYFNQKICDEECCKEAHEDFKRGKYMARAASKPKPKPISKRTKKKAAQEAIYEAKKKTYLRNNPICEVHDCVTRSNNIHHKAGRQGFADEYARSLNMELVQDERYFMACCETCHPKRIHENPKWAREHGYILTLKSR